MNIEYLNLLSEIIDLNLNDNIEIETSHMKKEHQDLFTRLNIIDRPVKDAIYSVICQLSTYFKCPLLDTLHITIIHALINQFNLDDTASIYTVYKHLLTNTFSLSIIITMNKHIYNSHIMQGLASGVIKFFWPSHWIIIKNKIEEVEKFLNKVICNYLSEYINVKQLLEIAFYQIKTEKTQLFSLLVIINILIKNLEEIIESQNADVMAMSCSTTMDIESKSQIIITSLDSQYENANWQYQIIPNQFKKIFQLSFNLENVESIQSHYFSDQKLMFTCIEEIQLNKFENPIYLQFELNQNPTPQTSFISEKLIQMNNYINKNNDNLDKLIFILKRYLISNRLNNSCTFILQCTYNDKNQVELLNFANLLIKKDLRNLMVVIKSTEIKKYHIKDHSIVQKVQNYNKKLIQDIECSNQELNESKQRIVKELKLQLNDSVSTVSSESRDSTDFSSKHSKVSSSNAQEYSNQINIRQQSQFVSQAYLQGNINEQSAILDLILSYRLKPNKTLKQKRIVQPVLYILKSQEDLQISTYLILLQMAYHMKITNIEILKNITNNLICQIDENRIKLNSNYSLDLLIQLAKKFCIDIDQMRISNISITSNTQNLEDQFIEYLVHKIKKIPFTCSDKNLNLFLIVDKHSAYQQSNEILKFNNNQQQLDILKNQIIKMKFMKIFENYQIVSQNEQVNFEISNEQNEQIYLFYEVKKVKNNSQHQISKYIASLQSRYQKSEIAESTENEIILKNLFNLILIYKLKFDIETNDSSMLRIANSKLIESINNLIKNNKFSKTIYEFLILSKINQMYLKIINNEQLEDNINEFNEIYSKNNYLMIQFYQIIEVEQQLRKRNFTKMNESQQKFKDLVKNNDLKETFKKNLYKLSKKIILFK